VQIDRTILESGYAAFTAASVAALAVIFVVIAALVKAAVAAESFRNERLVTFGFKVTRLVFVPTDEELRIFRCAMIKFSFPG
jgi:hypothetical protein